MKKWPIALQVYSVRDDAQGDFLETMKKVKAMGYDGVELAGTYGMTAVQAKEILDQVGLRFETAHVGLELLEDDVALDDYAAAGLKYVSIPWMVGPKNSEELETAIERIRKVGLRCKERGLQLLYHNHDFEFEKVDGTYILDAYYAQIPEDLLKTELDMCWVNVGGEKPHEYLKKYAGRAPVVHLKDFTGSKKDGTFSFRPVGYGLQDIPTIVATAEEAGSEWLVVEQDMPSMDKTPLECAQMSISYLKSFL